MRNLILLSVLLLLVALLIFQQFAYHQDVLSAKKELNYWLMLYRKSNVELLYFGEPGKASSSFLIKTFKVKSGIPGERPTPLPKLLGRDYWLITNKQVAIDLETAPFFLTLDIPVSGEEPFGPVPYPECNGECNWTIPGSFGLHGVAGDESRLSYNDPGSSGCIRHKDADITYLYNVLDLKSRSVRYYIEDI